MCPGPRNPGFMTFEACRVTWRGPLVPPGAARWCGSRHVCLWTEPHCPRFANHTPQRPESPGTGCVRVLASVRARVWLSETICSREGTEKAKTPMPTTLTDQQRALASRRGHLEPNRCFGGKEDCEGFLSGP